MTQEPATTVFLKKPSAHTVSVRPLSPTLKSPTFQSSLASPTIIPPAQQLVPHIPTNGVPRPRPSSWSVPTSTIEKSDTDYLSTGHLFNASLGIQQGHHHTSSDFLPSTNDAVIIPNIEHQDLQPGRGACRTSVSPLSCITISTANSTNIESPQSNNGNPEKAVLKSILKRPQQLPLQSPSSTEDDQQSISFPASKKSVHWNEVAHVREFYVASNFDDDRMGPEDDMNSFGDDFGFRMGRHHGYRASEEGNGSTAHNYEPEDRAAWFVENLELNMNHRLVGPTTAGFDEEQDQLVPDSPIDAMHISSPLLSTSSSFSNNHQSQRGALSPPPVVPGEQQSFGIPDDVFPAKDNSQHGMPTSGEMDGSASPEPPTRSSLVIQPPPLAANSKGRGLRVDTSGMIRPASPLPLLLSPPTSSPGHDRSFSPNASGPVSPPSSSSPMSTFSELFYGHGIKHRGNIDPSRADTMSRDLSPAPTSPLPPVPSLEPVRSTSPSSRAKERELKSLSLNALSDDDLKAIGRMSAAGFIHRLNEDAAAHSGGNDGGLDVIAPGAPNKDRVLMGIQRKRFSDLGKALPALPSSSSTMHMDDGSMPAPSASPFDNLTALNSAMNGGLPRLRPPRRGSLTITDLPPPKPLIPRKKSPSSFQGTSLPGLNAVSELHDSTLAEQPEEEEGAEDQKQDIKEAEGAKPTIPMETKNAMPMYSGKMFVRVLGFKALNLPSTSEPVYVYVNLRSDGDNPVSTPPVKLAKKTPISHEFCIPVCASQELSLSVHVRPDDHVVQRLASDLTAHVERNDVSKVSRVLSKSRSFIALGTNSASKLRPIQGANGTGGGGNTTSPPSPLQNRSVGISGRRSFLPTLSSSFKNQNQRSLPSTSATTSAPVSTPAPEPATATAPVPSPSPTPAPHPTSLHGRSHSLDDQSLPMIMLSKFISRTDYCIAQSGTIHFNKIRKRLGEGNPVHWSFEMMNDWHSTVLQEPASRNGSSIKALADRTSGTGGGDSAGPSSTSSSSSSSTVSTLVGVLELQLCYLPGVSIEEAPNTIQDVEADLALRRWKRYLWKEGHLSYLSRRGKGWRRDFYRIIGDALIQHDDSLRVLRAMDLSRAVDVKVSSITTPSTPTSDSSQDPSLTAGHLLSPPQSPTPISPTRPLSSSSSSSSSSATYISEVAMGTEVLQRQFVIEFSGGERVQLAADSEQERAQWIKAVRCVLDRAPPMAVAT
ncbi:hypothetical protein DFQ26_005583 [Actinomortierella ambigua]|nr:hypothetical protein DFQ26_005583 [Actinomortierella ambigua]